MMPNYRVRERCSKTSERKLVSMVVGKCQQAHEEDEEEGEDERPEEGCKLFGSMRPDDKKAKD